MSRMPNIRMISERSIAAIVGTRALGGRSFFGSLALQRRRPSNGPFIRFAISYTVTPTRASRGGP